MPDSAVVQMVGLSGEQIDVPVTGEPGIDLTKVLEAQVFIDWKDNIDADPVGLDEVGEAAARFERPTSDELAQQLAAAERCARDARIEADASRAEAAAARRAAAREAASRKLAEERVAELSEARDAAEARAISAESAHCVGNRILVGVKLPRSAGGDGGGRERGGRSSRSGVRSGDEPDGTSTGRSPIAAFHARASASRRRSSASPA